MPESNRTNKTRKSRKSKRTYVIPERFRSLRISTHQKARAGSPTGQKSKKRPEGDEGRKRKLLIRKYDSSQSPRNSPRVRRSISPSVRGIQQDRIVTRESNREAMSQGLPTFFRMQSRRKRNISPRSKKLIDTN